MSTASAVFAFLMYLMKAGTATTDRIARIATTIMSSISVKPFLLFRNLLSIWTSLRLC